MSTADNNTESRPRFWSRPQVRFLLIGLPLALGAGVLMATLRSRPARASVPETKTRVFMAEIRAGASLQPRQEALITQPKRPQRFAVWSQPVFQGQVDQTSVEALIAAKRAEALEGKMRPSIRAELSKHLFDTDQQIMQVGSQYYDEFDRVAALLRERREMVVIRTHPRKKDTRWPEVEAMQKRLNTREGLINGTYQPSLAPPGWKGKAGKAPMAFVFAAWKEWPIWRRYKEKYDLLLYQRVLQSRRWIASEYEKRGMSMFEN